MPSSSSPRKRRLLLTLVTALVLLGASAFWLLRPKPVDTLALSPQVLRHTVVASGRVRTPQRISLAAQINGRVEQVLAHEGDQLEAGARVLELDAREGQAQVQQARAALLQARAQLRQLHELALPLAEHNVGQAEANLHQAKRQHERARELLARGFYSQAQVDETARLVEVNRNLLAAAQVQRDSQRSRGSDTEIARSIVEQAKAALALAETRLEHASVRTPAAASVLTRTVEIGDTVQAGQTLFTLAPLAATELSAHIDEKNLAFLALGQSALASADAYPDQHFPAHLSYIAPSVDPLRGSVEIRLAVSAPPAYLRHEMTVSIDIETAPTEAVLSLPPEAVLDAGSRQPWVLIVHDGKAQRRHIQLGLRSSELLTVVDGLQAGDRVILHPQGLTPGSRVKPREQS